MSYDSGSNRTLNESFIHASQRQSVLKVVAYGCVIVQHCFWDLDRGWKSQSEIKKRLMSPKNVLNSYSNRWLVR